MAKQKPKPRQIVYADELQQLRNYLQSDDNEDAKRYLNYCFVSLSKKFHFNCVHRLLRPFKLLLFMSDFLYGLAMTKVPW